MPFGAGTACLSGLSLVLHLSERPSAKNFCKLTHFSGAGLGMFSLVKFPSVSASRPSFLLLRDLSIFNLLWRFPYHKSQRLAFEPPLLFHTERRLYAPPLLLARPSICVVGGLGCLAVCYVTRDPSREVDLKSGHFFSF